MANYTVEDGCCVTFRAAVFSGTCTCALRNWLRSCLDPACLPDVAAAVFGHADAVQSSSRRCITAEPILIRNDVFFLWSRRISHWSRMHSHKDKHILRVFLLPPLLTWITATICARADCACLSKIKYRCNKCCAVAFRHDPSHGFCWGNALFPPIGHFANKKPCYKDTQNTRMFPSMKTCLFPSMKTHFSPSSANKGWDVMTVTPGTVRLADPDKTVHSYTVHGQTSGYQAVKH